MRTMTGVLALLLAGAALAACNGAKDQTTDTRATAALSRTTSEDTLPEPPDEATPAEPIPPEESAQPVPDMRPDPLPPGEEPPTGSPPGSPPPPTFGG